MAFSNEYIYDDILYNQVLETRGAPILDLF